MNGGLNINPVTNTSLQLELCYVSMIIFKVHGQSYDLTNSNWHLISQGGRFKLPNFHFYIYIYIHTLIHLILVSLIFLPSLKRFYFIIFF